MEETNARLHCSDEEAMLDRRSNYTAGSTVVPGKSKFDRGINSLETVSTYRSDACTSRLYNSEIAYPKRSSVTRECGVSFPGRHDGTFSLGAKLRSDIQDSGDINLWNVNNTVSTDSEISQGTKYKAALDKGVLGDSNVKSMWKSHDENDALTKLSTNDNSCELSSGSNMEYNGNTTRSLPKSCVYLQRDVPIQHHQLRGHIFRTNKCDRSVMRRMNMESIAVPSAPIITGRINPLISAQAVSGFFWHRPFANKKGAYMCFNGLPIVETINARVQKSWHLEAISALTREQYASLKMIMLRLSKHNTNLDPNTLLVLSRNNWEVLQEGTFGTVYVGCIEEVGHCAIKIPVSSMVQQDPVGVMRRYINEWDILSRCNHPNIVKLRGGLIFGVFDIWLCTELIGGADLHSIKYGERTKRVITPTASLKMCRQLSDAVRYLHTQTSERDRIVHRDIKPENIIVMPNWDIKLCDFGDACESTMERFENISGATWLYAPPELLKHKSIMHDIVGLESHESAELTVLSEKWDIWSMGCVFQEMFGYSGPFHHLVDVTDKPPQICEKMVLNAVSGLVPCIPQALMVTKIGRLIERCLNNDADKRPTAAQICDILQAPDDTLLC